MANKYSRYQLQPYVSQYVDPQRVKIAQTLRDRWDKNKMQYDLLNRTANSMNVLDGDRHHKEAAVDNINSTFKDTISANNFENAGTVVSNAVTDWQGNEALNASRQSYANWEADQKIKMELRAKGQTVLFDKVYVRDAQGNIQYDENNQPMMMDAGQAHSSYEVDPNTGEVRTNIFTGTSEAQLNYSAKMEEMLQNIAEDPVYLQSYNLVEQDILGYMAYGTEIGEEKVKRIVNALQGAYLDSSEGRQQLRKLTELDINSATGQNFTQEEALNVIGQQMQAIGSKQIGKKLQYMKNDYFFKQLDNMQEASSQLELTSVRKKVVQNSKPITALDILKNKDGILKDKYFKDDGSGNYNFSNSFMRESGLANVPITEENIETILTDIAAQLDADIDAAGGDINKVEQAKLKANRDAYVANLLLKNKEHRYAVDSNGQAYFKNDKEFLQSLSDAQKAYTHFVEKMYVPNQGYQTYVANQVYQGTFDGVPWIVRNSKGQFSQSKSESLDFLANLYKQGGGSGKDRKKTRAAIEAALRDPKNISAPGFTAVGRTPGSHIITVQVPANRDQGTDAFSVEIEVGGTRDGEQAFSKSHEIMNNLRNHNYNQTTSVELGLTKIDGDVPVMQVGNYSYEFNPETRTIEPVLNIDYYKVVDGRVSQDIYKSVGPTNASNPDQWRGMHLIDALMEAEMKGFMRSTSYMNYLNAAKLSSSGLT